jgi:CRISPR type III-B/RAMP module-associated protein Cmr5
VATVHQRRASAAAQAVERVPEEPLARRYNALVHRLPVLLRTAGLAQALAALRAKAAREPAAPSAERLLAKQLCDLLIGAGLAPSAASVAEVHGAVLAAELARYHRMQEEAIAGAAWLKRFAAARFGDAEDGEPATGAAPGGGEGGGAP